MFRKFKVTRNYVSIMGGVCFILFALVVLFSANTPFGFLIDLISKTFGFVGFWLLLPFVFVVGLYLIMKKKVFKLRLGTELWGVFILIFCFFILTSHWGSWGTTINGVEITGSGKKDGVAQYLTFSNSVPVFNKIFNSNPAVIGANPKLGGGIVGYILAGALNSAITPVGLNVVCWALFIGSLLIIFNRQVKKLLAKIRKRSPRVRKVREEEDVNINIDEFVPEEVAPPAQTPPPVEHKVFENRPMYDSFRAVTPINNEYELKKARFVSFDDTNSTPKEVINETPRAYFETSSPQVNESVEFEKEVEEEIKEEFNEPFFEPLHDYSKPEIIEPEEEEIPQEVEPPKPKAPPIIKNYIFPSIDLLDKSEGDDSATANEASCEARTEIINRTLANLGIGAEIVSHTVGPSVTRYDLRTNDDVSITAVQRYIGDISVRLGGVQTRFEPIVAGKSTSGLEIANEVRTSVTLREAVEGLPSGDKYKLNIPFGKSISGELKFANLADFPHLLIAGTTGSGKSIFVHATIISLLMRNKPDELKLVMVDPKKVEMNYYDDIPHLLCPVISDLKKVYVCFDKLVKEMEHRYDLFKDNRVRDIKGYNEFAKEKKIAPLPYIVVFIDEYADLIETCKEVREPVVRIVQKARAAGIHMVFATQRPSVNVIDGVIKANVATRVALMCASPTDSITVIGEGGAEKLLGNGDMLVDCPLISRVMKTRVQGCYVSEKEIMRVCDFLREHYQPQFNPDFLNLEPVVEEKSFDEVEIAPIDKGKTDEEAYQKIKEDAKHREFMSISYITRTYGMGFSRAGKMFTRLQKEGIVATSGDARGCKVLVYTPYDTEVSTPEQSTFVPDEESSN